jgi:hypothetical protein
MRILAGPVKNVPDSCLTRLVVTVWERFAIAEG